MKNSDKPAYPTEYDPQLHWDESVNGIKTTDLDGLTKREKFAMAAMQGLLTQDPTESRMLGNPNGMKLQEWVALRSVEFADALLKELEGNNE